MIIILKEEWEKVFSCTSCALYDKKKIFYGYGAVSNHKVAFVFQNPGQDHLNPQRQVEKMSYLDSLHDFTKKTEFCRDDVLPWIIDSKYFAYFHEIIKCLRQTNIIQTDKDLNKYKDYFSYLSSTFLEDDVYFTDAIKCIATSNEIGLRPDSIEICADKWLSNELKNLKQLRLIICFGDYAADAINNIYNTQLIPIFGGIELINGTGCYVIKTTHPSRVYRQFNEATMKRATGFQILKKQQEGMNELLKDIRCKIEILG